MEDSHNIIQTVEAYLEITGIDESDLYIDMQLGFETETNDFTIEYGLTSVSEDVMDIDTSFDYETLPEAWENYLDQLPEITRRFKDAVFKAPDPEEYKAGKIGGNPVMSIPDATGEL